MFTGVVLGFLGFDVNNISDVEENIVRFLQMIILAPSLLTPMIMFYPLLELILPEIIILDVLGLIGDEVSSRQDFLGSYSPIANPFIHHLGHHYYVLRCENFLIGLVS